ncbi:organic radical activating enzyme [Elusimicrobium posterum]|uniref:7-carboxy-7-deazaguanine synthase QueE n=1 Tax=Elusimicrobium posterum TaxID=3116653 RepID=UPI003C73F0A4
MPQQSFKINEIFYSIQGEGLYTGCAMVFVRLSACSMQCSFCDTAHHKVNYELSAQDIIKEISKYPCNRVIITGGEPAEQEIEPLIKALKAAGKEVHVETNGSIYFDVFMADHVTVSPKLYVDKKMLGSAHAIKIVVSTQTDLEDLAKYFNYQTPQRQVFLQPESNKQENIDLCVKIIKQNPQLRLSLQTHKFANIR